MINIEFTPEEIKALHYERYNHPHPRVQRKMEVVYLKSQGLPHQEICRLAQISENTLRTYLRQYQEGGIERLKQLEWVGPVSDLADHRETLEEHFRNNPPRSVGEAAEAIERLTGIKRGHSQVRKFLKGMGLKFRKLGTIPAKVDPVEQRRFLDEELEPKLEEAKQGQRAVFFVDAAHFVHGPILGFIWCFARILMRGPSGRKRLNVLGAINAVTHELTTVINETVINGESVCELLRKLSAQYVGVPLTLVMDNARYQRCKLVQELAGQLGIELLFLPGYSPNLNIIERLWKFVKKEVLSCRYHEDFARFRGAIVECLDQVDGKHKPKIKTLLTLKFQTFENAQILAA